jgi:hypothetical protein
MSKVLILTAPIINGGPFLGEKHRPIASTSIGSPTAVPVRRLVKLEALGIICNES